MTVLIPNKGLFVTAIRLALQSALSRASWQPPALTELLLSMPTRCAIASTGEAPSVTLIRESIELASEGFEVATFSYSGKGEALAQGLGGLGVTGFNNRTMISSV
jgi:hypothetical protein